LENAWQAKLQHITLQRNPWKISPFSAASQLSHVTGQKHSNNRTGLQGKDKSSRDRIDGRNAANQLIWQRSTLPKSNIATENMPAENSLPTIIFRVLC